MPNITTIERNVPRWLPSLYFTKGFSQVALTALTVIFYKQLGLSNEDITFYVAWLYLPWVIKPLWQTFICSNFSNRWCILLSELLLGAGFGGVALTIHSQFWLQGTLLVFWLIAFACATHNEAADIFYNKKEIGKQAHRAELMRYLSQKVAMALGQGVLVMLVGNMQVIYRNNIRYSWSLVFYIMAGIFILLLVYHIYALPACESSPGNQVRFRQVWEELKIGWMSFFQKQSIVTIIAFLLLFRLPEALSGKVMLLFLLEPAQYGGVGLTPQEYGLVMGTVGIVGLAIGGLLGFWAIRRDGVGKWKWWMVCSMTISNLVYVFLSYTLSQNLSLISICVFVEQFGYGFGIVFYLHCLNMFFSRSSGALHRAIAKSFIALSMMLPTMIAGTLQVLWGYCTFFVVVVILGAVTFLVTSMVRFDENVRK